MRQASTLIKTFQNSGKHQSHLELKITVNISLLKNVFLFWYIGRTVGGVNKDERNPKIVTAQPIMFIKAIDIVMEKIRILELPFESIVGISGAAQVNTETLKY